MRDDYVAGAREVLADRGHIVPALDAGRARGQVAEVAGKGDDDDYHPIWGGYIEAPTVTYHKNGRVTTNWPMRLMEYRRRTRRFDSSDYETRVVDHDKPRLEHPASA